MTNLSQMTNEINIDFDEDFEQSKDTETSKKFLAFTSDGLHFAIDADLVIEIINGHAITHLPKTPDFIKGIINLRGQIIPIMDMRLRMNRAEIEYGREACIIVISVENISIGLLVESVSQMLDIYESQICAPPLSTHQDIVNGIARINNIVYLLLDCQLLLGIN
ncbi:MAG: chemotaxis protein CheW [Anaerovorax sp.]|nr:chemotaxis protein CheW [Anaerovorax sp.]